jgi:hypothetical protein
MNCHELAEVGGAQTNEAPRARWMHRVLVVANQTADSDGLIEAMRARDDQRPTTFTIVVPASTNGQPRGDSARKLALALERMHAAGLEVVGARVGTGDPYAAVCEVYDPAGYDEIIVSTLDASTSRWLALDVPRRVHRTTGAIVTHVSASGASRTFC